MMTLLERLFSVAWILFAVFLTVSNTAPAFRKTQVVEFVHHDNDALYNTMLEVADDCPSITRIYSIGKSVQGVNLYAIEMSDNPGVHEPGEPEFKYVGNMHGNEVTGRETLLHFMRDLCDRYGVDKDVTKLVDTTRIHILPTMNPDGYRIATETDDTYVLGRNNAHGIDLNRNFPDRFYATTGSVEPETEAVMQWLETYPFVLSANFHNGALVANYPYDNSQNGLSLYTPTEDNGIFVQLARAYSYAHATMSRGSPCPSDTTGFKEGITNGAAWYSVNGGMQDYNYLHKNCYEITVEQGCTKYPPASQLEDIWNANKGAMYAFVREVHKGVKGFVVDVAGKPVAGASIALASSSGRPVRAAKDGDFWRLLAPGTYTISASAPGFVKQQQKVVVDNGPAVTVNFTLDKMVVVAQSPPDDASAGTIATVTESIGTTVTTVPIGSPVVTVAVEHPAATTDAAGDNPLASSGATNGASSLRTSKGSQVVPMVIVGVILVVILFLLGAIVTFSVIIACHFIKSKHTRKGFAPLPLEEQTERKSAFNYKMVNPPTSLPLVEAPAYNDDPPAELAISLASDTEEIIYSANGNIATSKS